MSSSACTLPYSKALCMKWALAEPCAISFDNGVTWVWVTNLSDRSLVHLLLHSSNKVPSVYGSTAFSTLRVRSVKNLDTKQQQSNCTEGEILLGKVTDFPLHQATHSPPYNITHERSVSMHWMLHRQEHEHLLYYLLAYLRKTKDSLTAVLNKQKTGTGDGGIQSVGTLRTTALKCAVDNEVLGVARKWPLPKCCDSQTHMKLFACTTFVKYNLKLFCPEWNKNKKKKRALHLFTVAV